MFCSHQSVKVMLLSRNGWEIGTKSTLMWLENQINN